MVSNSSWWFFSCHSFLGIVLVSAISLCFHLYACLTLVVSFLWPTMWNVFIKLAYPLNNINKDYLFELEIKYTHLLYNKFKKMSSISSFNTSRLKWIFEKNSGLWSTITSNIKAWTEYGTWVDPKSKVSHVIWVLEYSLVSLRPIQYILPRIWMHKRQHSFRMIVKCYAYYDFNITEQEV